MEKSWDMIMENHPLLDHEADGPQAQQNKAMEGLAKLFGG